MADKRAYFKVDVGYLANPKVANLVEDNPRAVLLHLQCIAYATQHATNGVVPMRLAMRQACAEQCDLDLLMHCGLLVQIDERNVEVHDYLEHQRSAEEVKTASDKGKKAAEERWRKQREDASSNASSMPNPMPRKIEREIVDSALVSDFADWYEAYPKKSAKPAALKAYKAARKKVSAETLLAGASVMAQAFSGDKTYCPMPATWLNQERWADETKPHLRAVAGDNRKRDALGFVIE